jgi:hypothetical protein
MRRVVIICVLVIVVLLLIAQSGPSLVRSDTVRLASPIIGATIPDRYRDWKMITVAHAEVLGELRGVLGNDVAVKAYQQRTLPLEICPTEGLELRQEAPQAFAEAVLEVAEG